MNTTEETVLFLSGNTNTITFPLDNTINNVTSIEILRTHFTQSDKTVEYNRQYPFLILSNWYSTLQQLHLTQNILENITNTSIDTTTILNSSLTSYYLPNFNGKQWIMELLIQYKKYT